MKTERLHLFTAKQDPSLTCKKERLAKEKLTSTDHAQNARQHFDFPAKKALTQLNAQNAAKDLR